MNWALSVMMKYRMQVDFSKKTIDIRGYNNGWYWDGGEENFYACLEMIIKQVGKE